LCFYKGLINILFRERRDSMLRILREHATSWMLRGILILVAVTFISWGGYSLIREKKQTYAAKVNGVVIEMNEYIENYQGMIKQYREALGPAFTEKMVEELRIKENVLDGLIYRVLILQEGKRLGLSVDDEELRELIESTPSFQISGQFDPRLYERFLRLNRLSAEDFEQMQRETLLSSKMVNIIKLNSAKVSEGELFETFLFENERINLNFIKIVPDSFRGQVSANEIEVKDYYQKHQEEFKIPPFIQIQYLVFRPSDYEGKVQVSTDEIKRFYDLRKESFKIPGRIKAREILIKVDPQDPYEKIEEKRKKAEEILEKAKKTKDFASLAKRYSDSNTSSKGGDLGWVQRDTIDELMEKDLFSLRAGELSRVLKGRDGFYIFKIEEAMEEKQRSFEDVKEHILQTLKKEKARGEASRKAEDAFYSLFRSRDLEKFAREKNVTIRTTGFFKEGDEIPEIGRNPSFYSTAFSLKVGEISPVVTLPPNFYVLKLLDKKDSRIPLLEEVKEEVKRKAVGMKTEEKARQTAEELLHQIRQGKGIKEIAKERNYPLEETGFFARAAGVIPRIGLSGEFMSILSSLTEKNPLPKEALHTREGYFVVRLIALEPADQSKFQSVKKSFERRLIYQKQEEFYQSWLSQLRSKAKIEINKELL